MADSGGEYLVQLGRDIDLRHPGPDRRRQVPVRDAGRAVQHERNADGTADPGDEAEVQHRVADQHGVRAADRDRQRVHPGGRDETGGLVRIGASQRRVHAVLAGDFPEFRLDPDAPFAAPPGYLGGGLDVRQVRQPGCVVHDGPEAEPGRRPDQSGLGRVIQVHRDGHRGRARDRQADAGDGLEGAVVGGTVLADLEHHRSRGGLGPGDDRLGVLDADDVERAHAVPGGPGRPDDLTHGGQRHQRTSSRCTATVSSALA
jgi:hypothetical protein